ARARLQPVARAGAPARAHDRRAARSARLHTHPAWRSAKRPSARRARAQRARRVRDPGRLQRTRRRGRRRCADDWCDARRGGRGAAARRSLARGRLGRGAYIGSRLIRPGCPALMTRPMRGADLLAASLAQAGTRHLFSLSGNQIMPLFDAAIDARLDVIHVRHEGAAVHMADAWGRLTGTPGIALVTGGPGHANAIGALYTALAADSPMVLLSGHAPLAQLGMGAFQEMRQADMAAPVVKASWTAQSADALGEDIARALRIAGSGRPGPVHLSRPFDVLEAKPGRGDVPLPAAAAFRPLQQPLSEPIAREVAAALAAARRPLILAGPMLSAMRGTAEREALARASGIPVLGMESPRGVNDPALGAVAEVLKQADCVLLLGKRLDFTLRFGRSPAFAPDCRFIQIDPEEEALASARKALGDANRIAIAALA